MTDKLFISKFLDKNYYVTVDGAKICIGDKTSKKTFEFSYFWENHFKLIIGDYKTDDGLTTHRLLTTWFGEKLDFITKDLKASLDKFDFDMGADYNLKLLIRKNKKNNSFSEPFLIKYFHKFYNENILKPKIDNYITNYNNGTSVGLWEKFKESLSLDTLKQEEYARDYLFEWYSKQVISQQLDELFSEFVITLGPKSWVVTWVGQGILDYPKLMRHFRNETQEVKDYIVIAYDKWFENAVILATERLISKNDGS